MTAPVALLTLAAVLLLAAARGGSHGLRRGPRGTDPRPALVRLGVAVPAPAAAVALAESRLRAEIIPAAGLEGIIGRRDLARAQAGAALGAVATAASLGLVAPAAWAAVPLAAAIGWLAPVRAVGARARRRGEGVRRQLPDVLDVLALCTETGMAVDPALQAAAERLGGPLGEELRATLRDVELGATRSAAYADLTARAGIEEVGRLVAALTQADELGAPLSASLRAQAAALREARARAARDRAARAAPKIQLVVALLMVPAAMLLVLAVMVIELAHRVGPVVGGLQ